MNIFQLALNNIKFRKLSSAISILLFVFGSLLISLMTGLNKQITQKFENNLAGIDLVIGAKGSPLQMILCNMYHIDAPTGNISLEEAKAFFNPKHPLIEQAVPLSLGDNYKGYRIVGTDQSFFSLYDLELIGGKMWRNSMDVVLGHRVAEQLHLHIGDRFYSSHGLIDDDMHVHDDQDPFVVTGVLAPSNSVADQLILTPTPAVWIVHAEHETDSMEGEGQHTDHAHSHDEHYDHNHHHEEECHHNHHYVLEEDTTPILEFNLLDHLDKEITSILVKFKGRNFQTLNMQRNINENTNLQAATPAIEVNRVFSLLGFGFDLIRYIALAIMVVSGVSVFLSLLSSLQHRIPELALQRSLGAKKRFLFGQVLLEGFMLGAIGSVIGILLAKTLMMILSRQLSERFLYNFSAFQLDIWDLVIILVSMGIGILSAAIPAYRAYRVEIAKNL